MSIEKHCDSTDDLHQVSDYPVLASIGLSCSEIKAVAHQGFLALEWRGKRAYYRLRFRYDGRQQTRYVGSCVRAREVQAELDTLQSQIQHRRQLAILARTATQKIRAAKQQLEPLLKSHKFYFHGGAIRRCRTQR